MSARQISPKNFTIHFRYSIVDLAFIIECKNRSKYEFRFLLSQTETDFDFVTIYDGSNDQATQIAKLSGNLGSFLISSTGNSLFVTFKSDKFASEDGFLATIHYGNPYLNINNTFNNCILIEKFNFNTLSLGNCTTAINGDYDFCYCNKCSENEGHCDSHGDCQVGLACGSSNCTASLGFDSDIDCCYQPSVGDEHFCTNTNPCGEDEGDCDSHDECNDGLICGSNNCPFSSDTDCCTIGKELI